MTPGVSSAAVPAGRGYGRAVGRVAPFALLGLAILASVSVLLSARSGGVLNTDFQRSLWQSGRDLMDGVSPYGVADPNDPLAGDRALYPPIFIMLGLPLAVLPFAVAALLWDALLLAGVTFGLWVLGVRDWRCYALTLFSWPVLIGLAFGNLSLLLVLGVALVWRWRDRLLRVALLLGLLVAVKLFLWPIIAWLFVTRRFRAGLAASAACAVGILGPWALLGFEGLGRYPALLDVHTQHWGARSLSLYAAVVAAGGPQTLAKLAGPLIAVGLLALAARRATPQTASFGIAIIAAISSSPIVWQHYLSLLAVVVAHISPRMSRLWAILPAFWLILLHASAGAGVMTGWHRAVVYAVVAAAVAATVRAAVEPSRAAVADLTNG